MDTWTVVILSGMPASGKDTVTQYLCSKDTRYYHFKKHRGVTLGDRLKDTYYNISIPAFERKVTDGEFLQFNHTYGRYYGVDSRILVQLLLKKFIPIIHMGCIESSMKLREKLEEFGKTYCVKMHIVHIQLWETKKELTRRIAERDGNPEEVMQRRQEMMREFAGVTSIVADGKYQFTAMIKNEDVEKTCKIIQQCVAGKSLSSDGYNKFWEYVQNQEV